MPTCRACNNNVEVKWIAPIGATILYLEDLCQECLVWVEVAKSKRSLIPPNARRKTILFVKYDYEDI